jgi:2Fe-2S ferredoxin
LVKIVFHDAGGGRREIDAAPSVSIMRAARDHNIKEIVGECGGFAACGTCHVYVDPEWQARLPPAGDAELAMLEVVVSPQPNSRLSCQLEASDALDGLVLLLPPSQY